ELLKTLNNPPAIIFTTAYAEYAVTSYELNAIDYLLKPFSFERFQTAIEKSRHILQRRVSDVGTVSTDGQDLLFVKTERKLVKIDLAKLLLVEGLKDYIMLWMESER